MKPRAKCENCWRFKKIHKTRSPGPQHRRYQENLCKRCYITMAALEDHWQAAIHQFRRVIRHLAKENQHAA